MNASSGGNILSRYVCICCFVVLGFTSFVFHPRWQYGGGEAAISWDVSGYYWYLPSIFIYKDLKHQGFKDSVFNKYHPSSDFQQAVQLPSGNYVMKYSSGMAVMFLPSFAAGHLSAGVFGYPQDGFSKPYQFCLQLGAFIVALLGVWYLRKLLLYYYPDKVVAIVIAILVLGTNYLNNAAIDVGMSHGWLFTLYVFLLLNTHYFYRTFKMKYAVRIGLLTGLATLARPTEILSALIPLLWGLEGLSFGKVKAHIQMLLKQLPSLLVMGVCAAAVVSIQLIYWKYASGHWLFYSYQDQHLYFRSPSFYNYTFSYRSGWLRYTPMLIFAFIGFIPFWLRGKNKVAITAFFLLIYYVVCCWNIWWYGGRAMVQSYAIMMFPLAALTEVVITRKWLTVALAPVVLLFAYLDFWFIYQCHGGNLFDSDTMNKAYYKRVIGRWQVPERVMALRDGPDLYEGTPQNVIPLYYNDFEADTSIHNSMPALQGSHSLLLDDKNREIIEYKFACNTGGHQWLRFSAEMYSSQSETDVWKMAQLIGRVYKNGKKQKENIIRVYRILKEGKQQTIAVDMDIKGIDADSASISFWNGYSDKPLLIDNARVISFDGK
jgi:hypothetical protein